MTPADVLVIGSGPAGIAACIQCALTGLHTILVAPPAPPGAARDQASQSVHAGVASLLRELGAERALEAASRATYAGIWVGSTYSALGADENGPWLGHHLDRHRFDAELLARASASGVEIRGGEAIEILRSSDRATGARLLDGDEVRARFTIDASGRREVAARSLSFRVQFASAPLLVRTGLASGVAVAAGAKTDPMFVPRDDGWTWLAPEPGGRCTWTELRRKGSTWPIPPPELSACSDRGQNCTFNARWRLRRPLAIEGLLLAGEAGGTFDPAAGQGILFAIMAGMMAGHVVRRCVEHPARESLFFSAYDAWFTEQFERRTDMLRSHYRSLGIYV